MPRTIDVEQLCRGLQERNHSYISQAITLLESDSESHWTPACDLLSRIGKRGAQRTFRLALSGPPGSGKSTLIESLGLKIAKQGKSLAVLAIDPSSQISGGSILGDKTRMELLSREKNVFIRPSPNRGHLGGVTERLPATLAVCEAAGFDFIIVETVGVGQSETSVSTMVDHMTVLSPPGGGDDLQGIKKGVLEFVDSIVINKMDQSPQATNTTKMHLESALKIMRGRDIPIYPLSAITGDGVDRFLDFISQCPIDETRRQKMNISWFHSLLQNYFVHKLQNDRDWVQKVKKAELQIEQSGQLPMRAVQEFFNSLFSSSS